MTTRTPLAVAGLCTVLFLGDLSGVPAARAAQEYEKKPAPTQFEHPPWFKTSFLYLRDDVAAARAGNKRLILYIGQDGCPYCKELMENNFSQKAIVDYTRRHFDVLAINMWGDAEVTDFDGRVVTEKRFAEQLDVKYTPTLLFFDEQGKVVLRVNGYFPPHQLMAALEYVAGGHETSGGFREFYAKKSPPPASGRLHTRRQFLKPPFALAGRGSGKPLLVLFEQKVCGGCDFLHRTIFENPESRALLKRFDVAQLDMWSDTPVTTPAGETTTARAWARDLGLVYAPSAVLYGADNREVLRVEAMLKTFHVQSVMDYVASNAYREQPNLQRYIDERAGALRAQGVQIDLWN